MKKGKGSRENGKGKGKKGREKVFREGKGK